jgi:uncharacterized protein
MLATNGRYSCFDPAMPQAIPALRLTFSASFAPQPPMGALMFDIHVTDQASGSKLQVRVKPRSSRSRILEPRDGCLIVALAAPPVDGEANAELIRLLATATGLPKAAITVASGAKSRTKLLHFAGIDARELKARLAAAAPQTSCK